MTQQQSTPKPNNPTPKSPTNPTIARYRCPNCGQLYFCDLLTEPPDLCNYCRDFTTWQRLPDES